MSVRQNNGESTSSHPLLYTPRVLSRAVAHPTIILTLSYIIDWVVIIVAAVVGDILGNISPNKRPFNVYNPDISFPYVPHDKIKVSTLMLVSILAPAIIIFLTALFLVPGSTVPKGTPKALIWRRKIWEWFAGWTGLGMSSAAAFFITSGIKNLIGKPRPHMLSVCQPDLTNLTPHIVGGFGNSVLVSATACTNTDKSLIDDAFRSFPSGHSTTAAAGLVYLSLFLASKLSITVPFLSPRAYSRSNSAFSAFPLYRQRHSSLSKQDIGHASFKSSQYLTSEIDPYVGITGHDDAEIAGRNQAAAPPLYLLAIAFVPTAVAIYIASTRYSDFRHHGFDILFGLFVGTVNAIFAFRFYHLPISRGAGWAWGPRSPTRAFWAGIGVGSYVKVDRDDERRAIPTATAGRDMPGDDPELGRSCGSGAQTDPDSGHLV